MTHTATPLLHSAQLVHITPKAEELISYMARVSNPSNQSNTETSAKLIRYLINMCVEINTTRSIAAQILRHRSFTFQEFSQRYAEVTLRPEMPYFRAPDPKNRQNSTDTLSEEVLREADQVAAVALVESYKAYNRLLELGVAKECAREVLPLATPTRLYMNGTIRSWLHYCDLRTSNGTQQEHAKIAAQVQDILYLQIPNVCEAMWNRNLD
jgi:thymidylate synthase (FAD)